VILVHQDYQEEMEVQVQKVILAYQEFQVKLTLKEKYYLIYVYLMKTLLLDLQACQVKKANPVILVHKENLEEMVNQVCQANLVKKAIEEIQVSQVYQVFRDQKAKMVTPEHQDLKVTEVFQVYQANRL
jgi:hypothetical protein